MGIQEQGWLMDIIRRLFSVLDGLVYKLIKWILFGIFDLSNISTNSEIFSGIYSRIYVILGIFMAFKLSFSFFQYIMDPESMVGKGDKTLSKLFTRVFIMLAALIFLPMILFGQNGQEGFLARAQRAFLPTLPKVIFGVDNLGGLSTSSGVGTGSNFTDSIEQSSNEISATILGGFFAPPDELDDYCGAGWYDKTPPIKTIEEFQSNITETCNRGISVGTAAIHTGTRFYRYSYMWFISTIVGALVALLLLGITFDIAKRIFKLMILEVIAPIPIMSLIDPKGSKDGAFKKWSSSLISTFLDIFFKLGLVYLIIVFIHLIVAKGANGGLFLNFPTNSGFRGTYLTILLILGLILFAKEAPKFIKDAIGIKGEGGGLFDDVKTVGKAAGLVAGGAGVIGSAVASGRASYDSDTVNGREHTFRRRLKNVGAGLVGGIAGAGTAVRAATGKDGSLGNVLKAQAQRNANALARGASGSTWLGRRGSELSSIFAGQTPANLLERQLDDLNSRKEYFEAIKNRVTSKMPEKTYTFGEFGNGVLAGHRFNYNSVMAAVEAAQAAGRDVVDLTDSTGHTHTGISIADVARGRPGLLDNNEADFYQQVLANGALDDTLSNLIHRNRDVGLDNPYAQYGGAAGMKAAMGENGRIIYQTSRQAKRAKANDRYSATKK